MRRMSRSFASILVLGALLMLFPRTSQAYVDPGTGSYVLQVIIAGIAAASLSLRLFWGKLRSLFRVGSRSQTGDFRERLKDGQEN